MEVKVIKGSFEKRMVEATRLVAKVNEFISTKLKCDDFNSEDELKLARKLKEQVDELVDEMITVSLTSNELLAEIKANNIKKIGGKVR